MRKQALLSGLVILLIATVAGGQGVSINVSPHLQAEGAESTTYTITPSVTDNFTATILLRAAAPTLPGCTFKFEPANLNYPYQKTSRMTVVVMGAKPGGDHQIIVEGYNGPLVVRDTVLLTISERPAWKVYTKSNSPLPSDTVNCIAIDKNGVAWIGTQQGLVSFDKNTWTRYQLSVADWSIRNRVLFLSVDSANTVWVATRIGMFKVEAGVLSEAPLPGDASGNFAEVSSLAAGKNGEMWTVWTGALYKHENGAWTTDVPSGSGGATHVNFDGSNALWLMNRLRVFKYDGVYWTNYTAEELDLGWTGDLKSLVQGPNGSIWILTQSGAMVRFDGAIATAYPRPHNTAEDTTFPGGMASALAFGSDDTRWLGGANGLRRFQGVQRWLYNLGNSGLPSNEVTDVKVDATNTVWIGTENGLALLDGNMAPLKGYTTSVDDDTVHAVTSIITSVAPHPVSGTCAVLLNLVEDMNVRITLHNNRGQELLVLCDQRLDMGERIVQFDATAMPIGAYVLRLVAGEVVESRAVIVSR